MGTDLIDYYKILGVRQNASRAEIKSAYRKRARQFHPDLNKSAGASKRFSRLALGYRILSDRQSRACYDEAYRTWMKGGLCSYSSQGPIGQSARRVRRQQAIDRTVDRLLEVDRKEHLALQQVVYPCVTLLLSTFFAAAFRPTFYSHLSLFLRPLLLTLFLVGLCHLGMRFRFYLRHFASCPGDTLKSGRSGGSATASACLFLVNGLMTSFAAGLILGQQLSGYIILAAVPSFFDQQIRAELLLYPPVAVLVVDTLHAGARKLDL